MKFANRIGGEEFLHKKTAYKFEQIKAGVREYKIKNPTMDILDFGVGEPDQRAPQKACDILALECGRSENRFYSDNGIPDFQHAAGNFITEVFNVEVKDPEKQIIHGIGSKPILAMLPMAFVDPGDICLMTVPGYGILAQSAKYMGAQIVDLPLMRENDYLPDLDRLTQEQTAKASILYLNYPNNPTGRGPDRDFFLRAMDFCRSNGILLVHDAAYAALNYSYDKPFSVFSIPGAWDTAIEVHSLSKSFNMTGWRLGFALGNQDLIKAYGEIKINFDCGQFRAIQKAGVAVLENATELINVNKERYLRRRSRMEEVFRSVGWNVRSPDGGFYFYAPVPDGYSAQEMANILLVKYGIVVVPWNESGEYLRISLSFDVSLTNEEDVLTRFETGLKEFFLNELF